MDDIPARLRAVCDMTIAEAREYSGRHEYDGIIQDLSPSGVKAALGRLAESVSGGAPLSDPHDEAHLATFEDHLRVEFDDLESHRRNPLVHLANFDLACYDRDYAPRAERDRAARAHAAAWPDAADAAVGALDLVPAPVARALLPAVRGLVAGLPAGLPARDDASARAAHERLVAHIERAAQNGDPDPALGGAALTALMSSAERMEVDLGALSRRADAERDRLHERLTESCARLDPSRPPLEVARELVRDHPGPGGVVEAARRWAERAMEFTRQHDLVPYHDGECLVGTAPESRRWAMAMMTMAAPGEPEGPSWFHITPPDPSWPERAAQEWLETFSETTLPGIALHEVAPGHFSHGRALRRASTPVRRVLAASAFVEGWAHYAEEMCVEEGFGSDDPRIEIGIWLEALVRVTRLSCAIGVHAAGMTVAGATRAFEAWTHLSGEAAASEARRATFDPTYGRYTWGKLEIMGLREQARQQWGNDFTLPRFHRALLSLGAPPLGLMGTALIRG